MGAGIGAATLQRDETHATGAVRVRVAVHGPLYDIAAPAAWDFIEANGTAMDLVRTAGAVVFGTLAQRHPVSRGSIRALVRAAREAGVPCLADLNLRPPHFDEEIILWTLRNTDVLKMNVEELRMVSEMLGARGSVENLFEGLVREFGVPRAVVTDGADGAWICENGTTTKVPAEKAESVDPVGAGDAFTAMIACGLAKGTSLAGSAPRAAHLSAWVVASRGAAPAWTPELRRTLGD